MCDRADGDAGGVTNRMVMLRGDKCDAEGVTNRMVMPTGDKCDAEGCDK